MGKVSWLELKEMNEEQIRKEFINLSKEVERLSSHVISTESEHDKFLDDFGYCLDTLHTLRIRTEAFYGEKLLEYGM